MWFGAILQVIPGNALKHTSVILLDRAIHGALRPRNDLHHPAFELGANFLSGLRITDCCDIQLAFTRWAVKNNIVVHAFTEQCAR